MTEQQIQTKIKFKLEDDGYIVIKLIRTSMNGVPDLLAIKDGKATFIEVKNPNGVLSELQKVRIEQLRTAGCTVEVWTDYNTKYERNI